MMISDLDYATHHHHYALWWWSSSTLQSL